MPIISMLHCSKEFVVFADYISETTSNPARASAVLGSLIINILAIGAVVGSIQGAF